MENESTEMMDTHLNLNAGEALTEKTKFAAMLKADIDVMKANLEKSQSEFSKISQEIVNMLEALGITSLKTAGFNFYIEEKESVKTPKTLEDKRIFFDYLRSLGMFDEMVSINSQTLNALYKTQSEKALSEGILDFRMPGIEPATNYKNLKMRKI